MKKCCFIIPYFGKLPNFFQLFLNSCSTNKNYDWLLLTDDNTSFKYPANVKKVTTDFDSIVQLFSQKLDMQVVLPHPYKLCDYRPAYGYLFSDYITEYRFWGHCDIDTIMGDLDAFITNEMFDNYDKIFTLGHLTLYRNTPEVNRTFVTDGHYQDIFTDERALQFDEMPVKHWKITIDQLFEKKHLKIFKESFLMDVHVYDAYFRRVKYEPDIDKFAFESIKKEALYVWRKGKLMRYYVNKKRELTSEEFLYIHLQKRKMKMSQDLNTESESFKIVPNAFMKLCNEPVTLQSFRNEKKVHIDTRMLKLILERKRVYIIGFIYALYKGISPFTVEVIQRGCFKWNPHLWHKWVRFIPKNSLGCVKPISL